MTISQAFLVRRVLPTAILLLVALGLLYPFAELSPLEVIRSSFLPHFSSPVGGNLSFLSDLDPSGASNGQHYGRHPVVGGLLHVDLSLPADEHPIRQLISSAKVDWARKIARQSKTLSQAVNEYKRRNNGRNPPKGFDKWWSWREKNNVQLPDEYDQILKDLAPYRGFAPRELRRRVKHLQTLRDTFSMTNKDGKLTMHSRKYDTGIKGADERAQGQFDFIKDVAKDIPDFEAVFAIHDTPTQFVSYAHLMELQTADEEGEYWTEEEGDRSFSNWGSACPPGTKLYNVSIEEAINPTSYDPTYKDDLNDKFDYIAPGWKPFKATRPDDLKPPPHPVPGAHKSFVATDEAMLNLCDEPNLIRLHGALNGLHPVPAPQLYPIFSLSKTNLHADIMVIPIEQWGEDAGAMHWNEKEKGKLLWRGRNTGGFYTNSTPWRSSHRARIARMTDYDIQSSVELIPPPKWLSSYVRPANGEASSLDILGTIAEYEAESAVAGAASGDSDGGRAAEAAADDATERSLEKRDSEMALGDVIINLNQGNLNRKLFDVGLSYEPIQCDVEDGSCDAIKAELPFRDVKTFSEENHYQYILDIDGNAWSARFHRLLQTNSLILKSTVYPEWWNQRIQPWLHYVPVKLDFTDLYDIMTFFHGDGDGGALAGEELMARAIAESGRAWSLSHWRREDMTAYMYRLYLEWARLVANDRSSMDFVLDE